MEKWGRDGFLPVGFKLKVKYDTGPGLLFRCEMCGSMMVGVGWLWWCVRWKVQQKGWGGLGLARVG